MSTAETTFYDTDGKLLARSHIPAGDLPEGYKESSIDAIRHTARLVMYELGQQKNNLDLDHIGDFLPTVVSDGQSLIDRLPWLEDYYRNELRQICSEVMGEEALCVKSPNEMILAMAFGPGMRIEAHTDVWAINANLFLKPALINPDSPPALRGGTVIGHKDAKSHTNILNNPLAVVAGRVGTLTVLSASHHPHSIGVAESPDNFVKPNIEDENFWLRPETRVSFNI